MLEEKAEEPDSPSIFQELWWLDAASDSTHQVSEVHWDGKRVGSLPYLVRRRLGFREILLPPYTRTVDPHFELPPSKPVRTIENRIRVLRELVANLPPHDRMYLTLRPGSQSAFPSYLLGFGSERAYTFTSRREEDEEEFWAGLDAKTRNVVKNARKTSYPEEHGSLDRFLRQSRQAYLGNDRSDYGAIERIWEAARSRNQASLLSVVNSDRQDIASAFLVKDTTTLYLLLSARDEQLAGNGAISLMLLEAVRLAKRDRLQFDSDGFATLGGAHFLRRFGLTPVTRPVMQSSNRRWRLAKALKIGLSRNPAVRSRMALGGDPANLT